MAKLADAVEFIELNSLGELADAELHNIWGKPHFMWRPSQALETTSPAGVGN